MRRICLFALLLLLALKADVRAQEQTPIRGPITALWSDGDKVYAGRGSTLLELALTPDTVRIVAERDLNRGEIRDIAGAGGLLLVLTEDGLTALDETWQPIQFVRGGGQRLGVGGDRVYVAALGRGVRVLRIEKTGGIADLGTFATTGYAHAVAPDTTPNRVWVAEGDSGVTLYDSSDMSAAARLAALPQFAPATAVQLGGSRLFVGHGGTLSVFDVIDPASPKPSGAITLESGSVSDIALLGSRAYIGRTARANGPDVLAINAPPGGAPGIVGEVGERGAGERLTLRGDDVFVGSGRGIQHVRLMRGQLTILLPWAESLAPDCTPTDPQPPHLSVAPDAEVILSWRAACPTTSAYELTINGALAATLSVNASVAPAASTGEALATPEAHLPRIEYRFAPRTESVTWRVTAIDAAGRRSDGPLWRFEAAGGGWMATPVPVPRESMLYAPPLIDLSSPGFVLLATCAALCGGLALVIGAAWLIGVRAQGRHARRDWKE